MQTPRQMLKIFLLKHLIKTFLQNMSPIIFTMELYFFLVLNLMRILPMLDFKFLSFIISRYNFTHLRNKAMDKAVNVIFSPRLGGIFCLGLRF